MFKRKSNDNGDEGAPACKEQKVDPIPRNLSAQSITLHFTTRTWQEIAPGRLYYLPMCQTPKYMFDIAMKKQLDRFLDQASTFQIHTPQVRCTNLIMLQDDLRVQSNTPTDATAFTQVVYLMKYTPNRLTEYFKLQSLTDEKSLTGSDIRYVLQPLNNNTQLVELEGFNNFEDLLICPAKINKPAGWASTQSVTTKEYTIENTYIAPNTTSSTFGPYAANLQPPEAPFIANANHVTYARNLDKISMFKYGDTIELPITTNIEGVNLMNYEVNNPFEETPLVVTDPATGNVVTYSDEFCWPGPNRPYFSRKSNLDVNTLQVLDNKSISNIHHHFLCMPPIKKPNGALLGQRCSFLMEQSMQITINFTESVFTDEEARDMTHQRDGAIMRRNLYGKVAPVSTNFSPFCRHAREYTCKSTILECPKTNTWPGWNEWLGRIDKERFDLLWDFKTDPDDSALGPIEVDLITFNKFDRNVTMEGYFRRAFDEGKNIQFYVTTPGKPSPGKVRYGKLGEKPDTGNIVLESDLAIPLYVTLNFTALRGVYSYYGIGCNPLYLGKYKQCKKIPKHMFHEETDVQNASYDTSSKICSIFYC